MIKILAILYMITCALNAKNILVTFYEAKEKPNLNFSLKTDEQLTVEDLKKYLFYNYLYNYSLDFNQYTLIYKNADNLEEMLAKKTLAAYGDNPKDSINIFIIPKEGFFTYKNIETITKEEKDTKEKAKEEEEKNKALEAEKNTKKEEIKKIQEEAIKKHKEEQSLEVKKTWKEEMQQKRTEQNRKRYEEFLKKIKKVQER